MAIKIGEPMSILKQILLKLNFTKYKFWVIFLLILNYVFLVKIYFAVGHPYLPKQKSRPTGIYKVLSMISSSMDCVSQYDIPDYTNSLDEIQSDLSDIRDRLNYIENTLE
ncbi:MAG: hypothetical protein V1719_02760 [Patescibacteria group bacterium]